MRRRDVARAWSAPFALVVLLLLAGWMLYPAARLEYAEARRQSRLEQELARLEERSSELKEEVERLRTPEGVEEIARSELGMVKEGENLYVVTTPSTVASSSTGEPARADQPPADPLWVRLLDHVFGVEPQP